MKKGDKVKCVDRGNSDYLTEGKVYTVVSGEGDRSIHDEDLAIEGCHAFEIMCDEGGPIFCCGLTNSSHATWERVE